MTTRVKMTMNTRQERSRMVMERVMISLRMKSRWISNSLKNHYMKRETSLNLRITSCLDIQIRTVMPIMWINNRMS